MNYDEKLALAREDIARRDALKSQLQALYRAQKLLSDQKNQLEEARLREEKDVKRLEGFSLDAIFSAISGSKEEKLEKERREARDAALDYEQALRLLEETEEKIGIAEEELTSLRGCERVYRLRLDEKKEAVKASASPAAERISALEKELIKANAAADQIRTAMDAGSKALGETYTALGLHGDVIMGIAPAKNITRIMDAVDESRLIAEAQSSVSSVQESLNRFCVLLRNLNLDIPAFSAVSKVLPGVDFLYTAAQFSAGRIMDEIQDLQAQIKAAQAVLGKLLDEKTAECAGIRAKLDDEILNAVLPQPGAAQSDD